MTLAYSTRPHYGKYWGFFCVNVVGISKSRANAYPSETQVAYSEIRVYCALAEDWVGESRAVELLGIPAAELRALLEHGVFYRCC